MSHVELLSEQSKSLCVSHHCPACGTDQQVTAERVIEGDTVVTRCHCRACGHSWVPSGNVESL